MTYLLEVAARVPLSEWFLGFCFAVTVTLFLLFPFGGQ